MGPLVRLLRWATVEQYAAIDDEYRTKSELDAGVIWVLLAVTVSMILPRYFGRPSHITRIDGIAEWFATLPYPTLYPRVYWGLFKLVDYLLVPAVVIKLVFKERIRDFGFSGKITARLALLYLAMFLLVLPLVWIVSHLPVFLNTYPKYHGAAESWTQLVVWEATYGFQFLMLEFFFRGFMLKALARYIGHASIFVW